MSSLTDLILMEKTGTIPILELGKRKLKEVKLPKTNVAECVRPETNTQVVHTSPPNSSPRFPIQNLEASFL